MAIACHGFASADGAASALAADIADRLRSLLSLKTRAVLALSGGRSPQAVLPQLATARVDWSSVDVTLSDERWVPPSDTASNAAMIERCFLGKGAAAANFLPLWTANTEHADGPGQADARLGHVTMPPDIIYLGIGEDGHIASLFPTDADTPFTSSNGYTVATLAGAAQMPRPRISLDLPTILGAATLYLHFGGQVKASVYQAAMNKTPPSAALPLSLIVQSGHPDVRVFSFVG
tara:strand:+ start:651 stop:1352 length:702 start_codon:yes stop_codon:yes gene_type:complete